MPTEPPGSIIVLVVPLHLHLDPSVATCMMKNKTEIILLNKLNRKEHIFVLERETFLPTEGNETCLFFNIVYVKTFVRNKDICCQFTFYQNLEKT